MPWTQFNLDQAREAFDKARSFEDDDMFFANGTPHATNHISHTMPQRPAPPPVYPSPHTPARQLQAQFVPATPITCVPWFQAHAMMVASGGLPQGMQYCSPTWPTIMHTGSDPFVRGHSAWNGGAHRIVERAGPNDENGPVPSPRVRLPRVATMPREDKTVKGQKLRGNSADFTPQVPGTPTTSEKSRETEYEPEVNITPTKEPTDNGVEDVKEKAADVAMRSDFDTL